jgi:hypothetical protein
MKKIWYIFCVLGIFSGEVFATDWCSGENCDNKGYWHDLKTPCDDRYNCDKFCKRSSPSNVAVEETCSQGSKNCKCREPFPPCDGTYWGNCQGKWQWKESIYRPLTCGNNLYPEEVPCGREEKVIDQVESGGKGYCLCRP